MSDSDSGLQVCFYLLDGSNQKIVQKDPTAIERTLAELHPATIFSQDRATIVDEGTAVSLVLPVFTRIDLITDRLSVWDFPFVLGAPVEVTEAEFREGTLNLHDWEQPGSSHAKPVFLELQMMDGQYVYLWMEVVAGISVAQLNRIHALLKDRRLVFGLRTGGIGILNLANVVHFAVHPDPENPPQHVARNVSSSRPASASKHIMNLEQKHS